MWDAAASGESTEQEGLGEGGNAEEGQEGVHQHTTGEQSEEEGEEGVKAGERVEGAVEGQEGEHGYPIRRQSEAGTCKGVGGDEEVRDLTL